MRPLRICHVGNLSECIKWNSRWYNHINTSCISKTIHPRKEPQFFVISQLSFTFTFSLSVFLKLYIILLSLKETNSPSWSKHAFLAITQDCLGWFVCHLYPQILEHYLALENYLLNVCYWFFLQYSALASFPFLFPIYSHAVISLPSLIKTFFLSLSSW